MGKGKLKFLPSAGTFAVGVGVEMSGIEIPWLGYGLMGLGVLLLTIPLYPYVKRIRLQKPIRLISGKYETNLKHQAIDYDRRYADWMAIAIQDDVRDLPSCILIGEPHIYWEHLEEREDAYIEFTFNIWSSSVHFLKISKQVEGNIHLRGDCGKDDIPLKDKPEITQEASQLSPLSRGKSVPLTIKQWLSFTVKGRIQTHYRRSQVEFDFSRVNISVTATLPDGSQGSTCRLPIPDTVHAQVPDHPNPNAPVPDTRGSQS